jgi:hypothetical protein
MATSRFNANILAAAARVKDRRTTAASSDDSGKRFKTADWEKYQNRAIKDIVIETYSEHGAVAARIIPELVVTSGNIAVATGVGVYPSDAWLFIDLALSDMSKYIQLIHQDVTRIRAGRDAIITPSATHLYAYQEDRKLYVLPSAAYTVVGRYIKQPADLSVIITSGNGKYATDTASSGTVATMKLTANMNTAFVPDDVGNPIMFRDSSNLIWNGLIASRISATEVTLIGDNLPPGNEGTMPDVVMAESGNGDSDVALSAVWDGQIIERMVGLALKDAQQMQP